MIEKFLKALNRKKKANLPKHIALTYNNYSSKGIKIPIEQHFKNKLAKIKKEKVNVAISAHGNSMRPFRRYFEHLTIKQMMKLENPWDDYFEYEINI